MNTTTTNNNNMKNYFKTTETATVDNYPYSYLKCTATFGIEFQKNKGFRTTFQTINPKNGRLNAVKKSIYSDIILMYKDQETGHIKYHYFSLNGTQEITRAAKFMYENFDLFTVEQIKYIYESIFGYIKVSAKAIVIYSGADFEQVKPILQPATDAAIKGMKAPQINFFNEIVIDEEAFNNCRKPDYNPFVVTHHGPITLTGGTPLTK